MNLQSPKAILSVAALGVLFAFACNPGKFSGKTGGQKQGTENSGGTAQQPENPSSPGGNPTPNLISNPCVASTPTPTPTPDPLATPIATPTGTPAAQTPTPTPTPCVSTSTSTTGAILVPLEVYVMSLSGGGLGARPMRSGTYEISIVRNDGTEVCGQGSDDHGKCNWADDFSETVSRGAKTAQIIINDVCECGKANSLDLKFSLRGPSISQSKNLQGWSNVVSSSHTKPIANGQWKNKFLDSTFNPYLSKFKSGGSGSNSFYLGGWDYEAGLFGTSCEGFACDSGIFENRDDNMLYMTCQVQKCPNAEKGFSLNFVGESP